MVASPGLPVVDAQIADGLMPDSVLYGYREYINFVRGQHIAPISVTLLLILLVRFDLYPTRLYKPRHIIQAGQVV